MGVGIPSNEARSGALRRHHLLGCFLVTSISKNAPSSKEPLAASLLLVLRPEAPNSFLLLVVMPGATSSDALNTN